MGIAVAVVGVVLASGPELSGRAGRLPLLLVATAGRRGVEIGVRRGDLPVLALIGALDVGRSA